MEAQIAERVQCYHCGEDCNTSPIQLDDKLFCCEGCKMVYSLLNKSGLCEYYDLNQNPGINQKITVRQGKFAFLQDEKIMQQLISFKDETQSHVTLYLPQIHCSSCLWLLDNLPKLNDNVISSKVNFVRKEVEIIFNHAKFSLEEVAVLLTSIGYEPYISLNDLGKKKPRVSRKMIFQLGVAGFCFANVMLMSFPEYLGLEKSEEYLQYFFRYINLALALPVFFYSAQPFYVSAWGSLKQKFLNIDAPIVLAIFVTFFRSLYEILTSTGSGYFDSMTGIVFFMLIGRVLQDRTYQRLSFDRDYTSYFPIAVSVLKDGKEIPTALPDVKAGDTLLIHNEELVPADGIITRGHGYIDYSFVTGESIPVTKEMGEIIYAGGKQKGANIELLVIKEVAQSYLTKLWNNGDSQKKEQQQKKSFVHALSRYFTIILFSIALVTAIYWAFVDPAKIWSAVTAILIVACPCALLLSNTFTNGNVLRILSRNGFYLRNAETIEEIAKVDSVVFDKTGTLTNAHKHDIEYIGEEISKETEQQIAALASQSNHPLSRSLAEFLGKNTATRVVDFTEETGLGTSGLVNGTLLAIGSGEFITGHRNAHEEGTRVYVSVNKHFVGYFTFRNHYRQIESCIDQLKNKVALSVISGDNSSEKSSLGKIFGSNSKLLFNQKPDDKLAYIQSLQNNGRTVMMLGDGLNDAAALMQSNVGVAITDDSNNFTPASDAILEAGKLNKLAGFIRICKLNKRIVIASFILSIIYNIIGLSFAVQGNLSPLIAAILMPSSSLSIILLTFGASNLLSKYEL
ncbi:heavy metal translocating P-type ATPase metal-binding domain-containing protein [Chitinophagaceae bacterium 26-R-25]|nr:heavy metal translocating P-type ATPase metal-binding domain-containing protein [Chitinophagaceae bacterium 26-R-25]